MEIDECNDGVKIIHSWLGTWTIILSIAVGIYIYLVFNGGLGFFTDYEHDFFLPEVLVILSMPAILFMLVYSWLNQTMIVVDEISIEIRSFPLPFPPRRILPVDDIIDIHARNNRDRSKLVPRKLCEIHALNDKGMQQIVFGFLINYKQAERITKELKKIVFKNGQKSLTRATTNSMSNG